MNREVKGNQSGKSSNVYIIRFSHVKLLKCPYTFGLVGPVIAVAAR